MRTAGAGGKFIRLLVILVVIGMATGFATGFAAGGVVAMGAAGAEFVYAEEDPFYDTYDGATYSGNVLRSYPAGQSADVVRVREDCTEILDGAFEGSGRIGKVVIPASCKINPGSFRACKVASLQISSRNNSALYEDGAVLSPGGEELWVYLGGCEKEVYEVPDSVKTIRSRAFEGNEFVQQITMGDGVTSAGSWAFRNCTALKKIRLSKNIGWTGENGNGAGAFDGCSSLQSLTLPDTMKTIPNDLLRDCKSLNRLVIPKNVKTIKRAALRTGGAIRELIVYSKTLVPDKKSLNAETDGEGWYWYLPVSAGAWSVQPDEEYHINDGDVTYVYAYRDSAIAEYLMDASRLKAGETEAYTVVFRDIEAKASDGPDEGMCGEDVSWAVSDDGKTLTLTGTGSTDDYVLYNTTDAPWMWKYGRTIEKVVVGEGITVIGEFAFYGMPRLKEVVLPKSLKKISRWAFENCDSLRSVTIPGFVTMVENEAFSFCDRLVRVEFEDRVGEVRAAFTGCTALKNVLFDNATARLRDPVFGGCTSLRKLDLSNVYSIEEVIFPSCPNLTRIRLSKIQGISSYSFTGIAMDVYYTDEVPEEMVGQNYCGTLNWIPSGDESWEADPEEPVEDDPIEDDPSWDDPIWEDPTGDDPIDPTEPSGGEDADPTEPSGGDDTDPTEPSGGENTDPTEPSGGEDTDPTEPSGGDNTDPTEPSGGEDNSALTKPQLTAKNLKGKKIKLTWSKVEAADGYLLYVKLPGKKQFQLAVTKSARVKSVTHSGLKKGKKYKYKLRAFMKQGKKTVYGPYSGTVTVKVKK